MSATERERLKTLLIYAMTDALNRSISALEANSSSAKRARAHPPQRRNVPGPVTPRE
jgi:hypothetical protein